MRLSKRGGLSFFDHCGELRPSVDALVVLTKRRILRLKRGFSPFSFIKYT